MVTVFHYRLYLLLSNFRPFTSSTHVLSHNWLQCSTIDIISLHFYVLQSGYATSTIYATYILRLSTFYANNCCLLSNMPIAVHYLYHSSCFPQSTVVTLDLSLYCPYLEVMSCHYSHYWLHAKPFLLMWLLLLFLYHLYILGSS